MSKNFSILPDNWVILHFKEEMYRILCGWSGFYKSNDNQDLSSAITCIVKETDDYIFFKTQTDLVYKCKKHSYGVKSNNYHIYHNCVSLYGNQVELMDEDTDWASIDWKIKEKS